MVNPDVTPGAKNAVADLLEEVGQTTIGVVFMPDDKGWEIGYFIPSGRRSEGGTLATGYTLEAAARGAHRPFVELAEDMRAYRTSAR